MILVGCSPEVMPLADFARGTGLYRCFSLYFKAWGLLHLLFKLSSKRHRPPTVDTQSFLGFQQFDFKTSKYIVVSEICFVRSRDFVSIRSTNQLAVLTLQNTKTTWRVL